MENRDDSRYKSGDALRDAVRFMCDASFAVLPRDVAHRLGEFEKNFWGGVRWFADKQVGWIDDALKGGDRLREEWQRRSAGRDNAGTRVNYDAPDNI
jgi:hypothetical protein